MTFGLSSFLRVRRDIARLSSGWIDGRQAATTAVPASRMHQMCSWLAIPVLRYQHHSG